MVRFSEKATSDAMRVSEELSRDCQVLRRNLRVFADAGGARKMARFPVATRAAIVNMVRGYREHGVRIPRSLRRFI